MWDKDLKSREVIVDYSCACRVYCTALCGSAYLKSHQRPLDCHILIQTPGEDDQGERPGTLSLHDNV